MGGPKASGLQVIPHRRGTPGHVDDAGCASPLEGDAMIAATKSMDTQQNHLTCGERVIAFSFAGRDCLNVTVRAPNSSWTCVPPPFSLVSLRLFKGREGVHHPGVPSRR